MVHYPIFSGLLLLLKQFLPANSDLMHKFLSFLGTFKCSRLTFSFLQRPLIQCTYWQVRDIQMDKLVCVSRIPCWQQDHPTDLAVKSSSVIFRVQKMTKSQIPFIKFSSYSSEQFLNWRSIVKRIVKHSETSSITPAPGKKFLADESRIQCWFIWYVNVGEYNSVRQLKGNKCKGL